MRDGMVIVGTGVTWGEIFEIGGEYEVGVGEEEGSVF